MLRDKIAADTKDAMKAGEKLKVSTLRMVTAEIKKADMALPPGRDVIDEAAVLAVLGKMVKQRRDAADQFTKGNRKDLADNELAEIALIEGYLPKQMSEADMRAAITKIIKDTGAAGPKDMGKVMGALKAAYAGQMDFGKVNGLVKELLK